MKIAICGIGPAGLFAAWAARDHQITLFDRDVSFQPWRIFALQYLHAHCDLPAIARKELAITYKIDGGQGWAESQNATRIAYNLKLGRPEADVNSTRFAFDHPKIVFSLKHAYTWLWREFTDRMRAQSIDAAGLRQLATKYDLVISTVPLDRLFPSWPLAVTTMRIAQGYAPIPLAENECVMNIDPDVPWSRTSRIDGGLATEYLREVDTVATLPLRKVIKPETYPKLPDNVLLRGRWGSWDPRPLSHDTYFELAERLAP